MGSLNYQKLGYPGLGRPEVSPEMQTAVRPQQASESHAMHAIGTCVQACGMNRRLKGLARQRLGIFGRLWSLEPMRVQDLYLRLRQLLMVSPNTHVHKITD